MRFSRCYNTTLTSTDPNAQLVSEFRYDTEDPFAVTIVFVCPNEVEWQFARDLLAGGLKARTGDGDVTVFPQGDRICVELKSDGYARLEYARADVEDFVGQTVRMQPLNCEIPEQVLDREIAEFLRDC